MFAPKESVIRRLFAGLIPSWVRQLPTIDTQWDALLQTLEGHTGSVTKLAFSPDGKSLASGCTDGAVRLWDITTGEAVYTWESESSVWCVSFSPNGSMLAAGFDCSLRLWDTTDTGILLHDLGDDSQKVTAVTWLSNGRPLALASENGKFNLWDAVTGALLRVVVLNDVLLVPMSYLYRRLEIWWRGLILWETLSASQA